MNRRNFLTALIGTPALAAFLAACGDDTTQSSSDNSLAGALDEVVLRIGYEGGFVPAGTSFLNLPTVLVTGDGRVFTPGAVPAVYPGPLLQPMFERSITEQGIATLIEMADAAGLLGVAPDYSLPAENMIADAPDTVVAITVNGTTSVHRAYALGIDSPDGGPSTPARDNLLRFVTQVTDVATAVGSGNVGSEAAFAPDGYRFQAMVVDPTQWADPAPTIVEWPADAGAVLADSTQCAVLAGAVGDSLFVTATQLTFFQEAELVYQLSVAGVLPGDPSC
ncbi:MAG: hypothetical protein IPP16_16135 [Acidimicrobiaceae bacterium]|jgi:hypothetical protein|nr:hypothetical protein [Acidimicrobiaceae bacterium]HRA85534.1 hypothetical protein [Ilumatobacteraceae bacterium]